MRLKKVVSLLMIIGGMSCARAHAVPVDATTTLKVGSQLTFTHTLTAVKGLSAGILPKGTPLAQGLISANQKMKAIQLSWDRTINPQDLLYSGSAGRAALMRGPGQDIPVEFYYDVSQVLRDPADDTGINIAPSIHAQKKFPYSIIVGARGYLLPLKGGQYKLGVLADVTFA
ncbi:hypothetical protein ABL602_004504 [Salmonella enterica subsp. enterica]|nr:hypothetical protein [Salmonella enterica subsp. enterica]EDW9589380.1 hypothetical protein [Salmonella enterica subsp. enterica]EED9676017.1 hypothetical protein [Salmonella enterica subsp. enterica]EIO7472015.1 hypothetical protein [Salmonella enterica subsp. enterica]EIY5768792.1 hypothetical protein [Salmonella enterica subsp. enterica]